MQMKKEKNGKAKSKRNKLGRFCHHLMRSIDGRTVVCHLISHYLPSTYDQVFYLTPEALPTGSIRTLNTVVLTLLSM